MKEKNNQIVVISGNDLKESAATVAGYGKRKSFEIINDFIYNNTKIDRVLILYGLRRTGKTTLIWQTINEMQDIDASRSAYILINNTDCLGELNKQLQYLYENNIKYIFIDEITRMQDFIDGSSLLSDIYARRGMKIVLSGTDSLGFMFASDDQLYNRCHIIHTTIIPYYEYNSIFHINSIDKYIHHGGTMCSDIDVMHPFHDINTARKYTYTAIINNIIHSLRNYHYEKRIIGLRKLYESEELGNAINRIIEDTNHNFFVKTLTKDFISNDLSRSQSVIRTKETSYSLILDKIDKEKVIKHIMSKLDIRNNFSINGKFKNKIKITQDNVEEIKEYLIMLDLIREINEYMILKNGTLTKGSRILISQPGLRYCQLEALISSLQADYTINQSIKSDKRALFAHIRNIVKGCMLEDIILFETMIANENKEVFVLKFFQSGEFDMVIQDINNFECEIFEIKHSSNIFNEQYKHLSNENNCNITEQCFGKIIGKYVLYNGCTKKVSDLNIKYINIEQYLNNLYEKKCSLRDLPETSQTISEMKSDDI